MFRSAVACPSSVDCLVTSGYEVTDWRSPYVAIAIGSLLTDNRMELASVPEPVEVTSVATFDASTYHEMPEMFFSRENTIPVSIPLNG